MRVFNRYIWFLLVAACIINTFLAFSGQNDLSIYFIANVIAYLAITVLHAYLNPGARRSLSAVAIVLFAGFMVIVIIKAIDVVYAK